MWHINYLIYLSVFYGITHVFCERHFERIFLSGPTDCFFYNRRVSWYDADHICNENNMSLMCYESKEFLQQLVDENSLMKNEKELSLWVTTCKATKKSRCFVLKITKSNGKVEHYIDEYCWKYLPFICCSKSKMSSEAPVETTVKMTTKDFLSSSSYEQDSTFSTQKSNKSTVSSTTSRFTSTTSESVSEKIYCKSIRKRGITWPQVPCGKMAIQPCPANSLGTASWLCLKDTCQWSAIDLNVTQCSSKELQNLKEKFDNIAAEEVVETLNKIYKEDEVLQGNDLLDSAKLIYNLPERLRHEMSTLPAEIRYDETAKMVNKMTSVFDKLIISDAWTDITEDKIPTVGSQILSSVESFGLLLADSMSSETKEHSIVKANMMLEIIKKNDGDAVTFPRKSGGSQRFDKIGLITLHNGYKDQMDEGATSIVFTFYNKLNKLLGTKRSNGILNSPVVSVSVGQKSLKPVSIKAKVHILVENLNNAMRNNSTCVFWNLNRNIWDDSGCILLDFNGSYSLCECDHLTNFAVLVDYNGVIDDEDSQILILITVIGCSISIVSLAVCVIIFTCFRYQHKNAYSVRYSIHRNLCITLFMSNILLITGLDQTGNRIICGVIAGFLHYFFLSAFSWMLLEGVHIYFLLVIVFASKKTHWKKYYSFGYGFPLVIVTITAICSPESYGTAERCWLSREHGAIWSFTGPVAAILFINLAALILAQWKASKISVKKDSATMVKGWLRVTVILFPILGLTWILGFLFVGKQAKFISYLFALLNSLQGLCIFICHCIMDKKVRNMVSASIRKRTTTIQVGSTESKRTIKRGSNTLSSDIEEPESLTKTFRNKCKRKWDQIKKPWSFCFVLEVSNRTSSSMCDEDQNISKPVELNNSKH